SSLCVLLLANVVETVVAGAVAIHLAAPSRACAIAAALITVVGAAVALNFAGIAGGGPVALVVDAVVAAAVAVEVAVGAIPVAHAQAAAALRSRAGAGAVAGDAGVGGAGRRIGRRALPLRETVVLALEVVEAACVHAP